MSIKDSESLCPRVGDDFICPLSNVQASIRSLVNERRQLRDRLSRRNVNTGPNRGESKQGLNKRGRTDLESVVAIDEGKTKHPRLNSLGSTGLAVQPTTFPVEKRPNLQHDDSTVKRNRNLFGSLVGHLKKAKTVLEQEKTTKAAELHRAMEEQVSQKLDLEKKNLAELRRRDFQERQRRDLARIREVQIELEMKENDMLSLNLQRHFKRMRSFIRTETCPMIFWIPCVHNNKTKEVQFETARQIERKLGSLIDKFEAENTVIRESLQNSSMNVEEPVEAEVAEQENTNLTTRTIQGVHPDLVNDSDEDDDNVTPQSKNDVSHLPVESSEVPSFHP